MEDSTNREVGGNDVITPEEIGIDLTTPRAMQVGSQLAAFAPMTQRK